MGKYTRIVYIENIFEREGAVIYDFYENVLIAWTYGVNFRNYNISKINQFFKQLRREIEQKHGTEKILFEGNEKKHLRTI